jgi:hypothetical protein
LKTKITLHIGNSALSNSVIYASETLAKSRLNAIKTIEQASIYSVEAIA